MDLDIFRKNFEKKAPFNKITLAQRTVKSGRVIRFDESLTSDNKVQNISAHVLSSNNRRVHNVHLKIDNVKSDLISTECNCREAKYQHNQYICKHIAAVLLRYIELLEIKKSDKLFYNEEDLIKELSTFKDKREIINLSINLTHQQDYLQNYIAADFKIGKDRLYVLKNIKEFIKAKDDNKETALGKGFSFIPQQHKFNETDENIIEFIEEQLCNDNFTRSFDKGLVKGKYLNVTENSFRRFFKLLLNKRVSFNGEDINIINDDIPVNISINEDEGFYIVDFEYDDIKPLNSRYDVCLFNNNIYIPSKNQSNNLALFSKYIKHNNKLSVNKEHSNEFFNIVMPRLNKISHNIKSDNIKNYRYEKHELKAEFYLDIKNKKTVLDVKLIYGEYSLTYFNVDKNKIILRDHEKEEKILNTVISLDFQGSYNEFIFDGSDEELYEFITDKYKKLEILGEVYYSERFKSRKVYYEPVINAKIENDENSSEYLDFSFDIEGIDSSEYKGIITAIKSNRRFFKLKDDSFLNIEGDTIRSFFDFIENVDEDFKNNNGFTIHKSKAVLLNNSLEKDKNLSFIKGKDLVKNIADTLENIDSLQIEIPKNLNADLRDYQVIGFKWFKTLSYLGFGGILADEMGLGKTIQTISFLLSEKGKKSLIITPMSLVYNWKKEFFKFAPSMNVGIIHGNKNERIKVIEEADGYDVLLTTYGSLKNDLELYSSLSFNYAILDEGQNIKNPVSKASRAVKSIKADNRFVLSGTPMENNLVELWSLFDFIMPGYLNNLSSFKKRFLNNSNNYEKLKNYIDPFILRRIKMDVINELPEKIEKKHYVELNESQKKIYYQYVKEVREIMECEDFNEDKITMFSYLMKLRQICLDPSIIMDDYKHGSSKIKEAMNIIKTNINNNHKVLLFSQFTSVLKNMQDVLDKENISYLYIDGKTKAEERIELVDKFNNDEGYKVFLISLKAGGTGLNLTSADIVIHFDPWYNPAVEDQASDRAHRIGQKNIVKVFKLISQGTVEEKIITLQEDKKKLIGSIISNGSEKDNFISSLTKGAFISLFLEN